tara:strand:+ start:2347 stop:2604 length:258 start_codon:yes stop_codon:yes gene_type:complete
MSQIKLGKLQGTATNLNQVTIEPGYKLRIASEGTIDMVGTGAFQLPSGTTAQRPASPQAGYMRWNTTTTEAEFYNGTEWKNLSEE